MSFLPTVVELDRLNSGIKNYSWGHISRVAAAALELCLFMLKAIQLDILLPASAFFVAVAYILRHVRSKGLPFPPGPKRIPIIGNLIDMPSHEEWKTYKNWSDQYGREPRPFLFLSSSASCDFNHHLRFRRRTYRRSWNAYYHRQLDQSCEGAV